MNATHSETYQKALAAYDAKNYDEARSLFEQEAEAGNTDAMVNLGTFYMQGAGVERNGADAAKWYEKAAEGGNMKGMANLAMIYENGIGVTQDLEKALNYYKKAGENGDTAAAYQAGSMMVDGGHGLTPDYKTGMAMLLMAADKGYRRAVMKIGSVNGDYLPAAKSPFPEGIHLNAGFRGKSLEEQIPALDAILEEKIRPMLRQDGGDVTLVELLENGKWLEIRLKYLGNCVGCSYASSATLTAIKDVLYETIDKGIRVIAL